jgi:hypothetical protein
MIENKLLRIVFEEKLSHQIRTLNRVKLGDTHRSCSMCYDKGIKKGLLDYASG